MCWLLMCKMVDSIAIVSVTVQIDPPACLSQPSPISELWI